MIQAHVYAARAHQEDSGHGGDHAFKGDICHNVTENYLDYGIV